MKRERFCSGLMVVLGAYGCGGSTGLDGSVTGTFTAALVGSWETVCSRVSDPTGTRRGVNLVSRGTTFTLSLGSDGSFTRTAQLPEQTLAITSGTVTDIGGGSLDFTPQGGGASFRWDYVTVDFGLSLSFSDAFDFDGNGVDDGNGNYLVEMVKAGRDRICPSVGVVVGSWTATTIQVADPGGVFPDSTLGVDFAITLGPGGEFEYSLLETGEIVPDTASGVFMVIGATVFFNEEDSSLTLWEFTVGNGVMEVEFSDTFDFDGNGAEEPANFTLSLVVSQP